MKIKNFTLEDITDEMVLFEHFGIHGIFVNGELIESPNPNVNLPTKEEIDQARISVYEKKLKKFYIIKRAQEYPPVTDYIDAAYWQSQGDDSKMQAYMEAVKAVKEKYPKEQS